MIFGKQLAVRVQQAMRWLRRFMGTPRARQLVLGLFVAQAVLLAFVMRPGVPPDELNHIKFIEFYASHSLSPIFNHQKPTYNLGDKTRELGYIYHYLMSLVYRVLPLAAGAKYVIIRLFSVVIGLLTCITLGAIARRLKITEAATTTALLVLTNLPMVLMMSAAINNDAPVWLGVALAVLLLLRLWEKSSWLDLLLLAEIVIIGGLVKETMLPFGLMFAVLGIVIFLRRFKDYLVRPMRFDWRIALVVLVLAVSSGLAIERIGGNLVRYHTPTPSCEQVQGVKACAVFWANVRQQSNLVASSQPLIPFPMFVPFWIGTSFYNIVDIQTQVWRHEVQPAFWLTPLLSSAFGTGLAYGAYLDIRLWRQSRDASALYRLGVMAIGLSILAIHFAVNYQVYLEVHILGQALNGRYILPGIFLLAILSSYYWTQLLARHRQLLAALATVVVVATLGASGLIMILRNSQLRLG